jgi:hypothetical protein
MQAVGRYDGSLQMFVEEAREPDPARLGFLRWLVETGRLTDRIINSASGDLVSPTAPTASKVAGESAPSG